MNRGAGALLALAACKGAPVVSVIQSDHNALSAIVAVREKQPVHAEGRCVADDDPDEVRILDRQGPADAIDLYLAGLRDDTTWTCTVDVDRGKRVKTHEVEVEPGPVPLKVGGYAVEGHTDPGGITVITAWDHDQNQPNVRTEIVDAEGRVRWYRFTDHEVIASLDSTVTDGGQILTGGGPDQPPTWYDVLGDAVAALGEPPIPGGYHHHTEPFEGGVVTLSTAQNTRSGGGAFQGFAITWFGPTGTPEWTWNSQQAVDAGTLVPTVDDDGFHANAVALLDDDHGPAAWVSLYSLGQIARIDRDSGEVTHVLGVGGDFELRDPTGAPLPAGEWFFGQHDPEIAWPRMLVYDNGIPTGESRAIELELDLDAGTATLLWQWSDPGWFEPFFGDADRLEDGGVLLTRGRCWESCSTIRPLDDRLSNIVELDPTTGEVGWRLSGPDEMRGFYRADRADPCLLWHDPAICD